ncbi:MAG: hypothetical protein WC250_02675 [Candidatus Paceibacterota bacterium]|jgi:cell division protein FtsB
MREFQERRKIKRLIYSQLTLVVLILFFLLLVKATWGVYEKNKLSANKLTETEKEYNSLQLRRSELGVKVNSLETESGVEAAIREKFPVAKAGEKVVFIVDQSATNSSSEAKSSGFWSWLVGLFK